MLGIFVSLSQEIGQNLGKTDVGISNFRISGQSLIKVNRHNSRTSEYINMKFGLVNKLDKRNKTNTKFDDGIMLTNCDIIFIFPVDGEFGAIWK